MQGSRAVGKEDAPSMELERFKADINLVELACLYGYECVRQESSRASIVMEHADGDKIVIATASDGHMVFFSVRGYGRSGSVIDFVMYRERVSLGGARVILRRCLVLGSLDAVAVHYKPEPTAQDTQALAVEWHRMKLYKSRGYLALRGLSQDTIIQFSNRIRVDQRGNVALRHDDMHGLAGWEMKNRGFTGFSAGGRKALFCGKVGALGPAPLIVITESAIDAMSYYQLKPQAGFYLSFAGGISGNQWELLAWVIGRYPQASVIAATDNDDAGMRYAEQICQIRSDIVRECPPVGKDWNDTLNGRSARS